MVATDLEGINSQHIDLARLFAAHVRAVIAELPRENAQLIRWLYGIDGESVSPNDITQHLGISTAELWHRASGALEAVGSLLVMEAA